MCTYALVLGQCLAELNSKIKESNAYFQANTNQDMVQLLSIIQGYCCQFDNNQQSTHALKGAKHQVSTFYQSYNAMTMEYVEHFEALVGVMETYSRSYRNEAGLIKAQLIAQGVVVADLNDPNRIKKKKALAVCHEEYLWCMILQQSDNTRFYQLKINLANSMTMGQDHFTKTMVETQRLLINLRCH